jgi:hypothetical protein
MGQKMQIWENVDQKIEKNKFVRNQKVPPTGIEPVAFRLKAGRTTNCAKAVCANRDRNRKQIEISISTCSS